MSKSLFEEAIADAKQLREAAEANAKNAIIEAVTPRIREFIETQLVGGKSIKESNFLADALLSEDAEEENDSVDLNEEVTDADEVELDETALRSLASLLSKPSQEDVALKEAFDNLTEAEQDKLIRILREQDAAPGKIGGMIGGSGINNEEADLYEVDLEDLKNTIVKEMKTTKMPKGASKMSRRTLRENYEEGDDLYELDEMMDDSELEEAILKLVGNADEREAFDKLGLSGIDFEEEEGEGEEVEVGEEEEGGEEAAEMPPEGADEEPMAEDSVYEIDENMLRQELMRLREGRKRKSKKGGNAASHKAAAAAFGGGMLEGDPLDVKTLQGVNQLKKKALKEAHENRALKTQLNEYRSAVQTLREQLSDLNLFNAKLLYVNKILQNKDVSPGQRRSMIEALDGAANLREAKLLYQSLATSIESKNASINESVRHTAGMASRPVTSASARIGAAGELDRWALLAGIK